ncbi:GTPase-activating protein GYP5 [Plectosphaerella plurivora]|uniref:GTPase-activating protein GYP5 n=1 Tax=Plectosphaerella plurivora TaxID=936078 RepID=A0A9P9AFV8_9PEZI|nr:GTPase-activating protein GYP5 [Plectosphaerella plurivora]
MEHPEPQQLVLQETSAQQANVNSPPESPSDPAHTKDEQPGSTTPKMTHDSMVTVRLSEPPVLTINTSLANDDDDATPRRPSTVLLDTPPAPDTPTVVRDSRSDLRVNVDLHDDKDEDYPPSDPSTPLPTANAPRNIGEELMESESLEDDFDEDDGQRRSQISRASTPDEVNWDQLERSEAEEPRDEETDKSTAMLLAMLEQENAKLATNPKSVKVKAAEKRLSNAQRTRPPSMAQLRDMVNGPTPPALRYSMLPPPPMTDLEFYLALVKDYHQTAARLPTLLSNKIRKGVPPPLRGVVWQSMSGARDAALEEQYERFLGESSPYEPIIGKDLNRSFPGVDMFRDPDGDGQRMLGKVLKCFSLYDQKIGYCQGLAFLVGPLLMHMPDKQAFCVLVRLMERYELRSCFLPDLSGLHVRIYQFRELLRETLPALSGHLEDLQVDPAYVSQWFLSFFAVTCPLPMLFRIYDVIFAEGASETLMRVALSLMRKNQGRLLSCTEFEDVMQLLLSRGLWDCYHYNADEFVQDFVSLTGVVSREKLLQLEQGYREAQIATANAARTSDVATAASRFLGRIWASTSPKPSTLSPGFTAPSRPLSMLRRSTSKQSLASTLNSMEASSASVTSSTSTDATTLSRDSAATNADDNALPAKPNTISSLKNNEERQLHSQIEDLLTALTELQRNHALLASELQKEREQREDDRRAVRSLLDGLRKKASIDSVSTDASAETVKAGDTNERDSTGDSVKDATGSEDVAKSSDKGDGDGAAVTEDDSQDRAESPTAEDLSQLLDVVEQKFALTGGGRPRSSTIHPKTQLKQELEETKEKLASAISQSQDYGRKLHDIEQEVTMLRDQLKDSHTQTRSMHQDKQRLERQIHNMRARASAADVDKPQAAAHVNDQEWPKPVAPKGGLRELKLGRSQSTPSQAAGAAFGKRTSSLPRPRESVATIATMDPQEVEKTNSEHEALVLELVQAKTAEAIARQEADEFKQKLEQMRKAYGAIAGEHAAVASNPAANAASAAMGVFGRLTGAASTELPRSTSTGSVATPSTTATPAAKETAAAPAAGGFWGWRRT